jgi:serine phosphatase RsbU (regulator of sigma subunit)
MKALFVRIILLFIILFPFLESFAQQGTPYITNYKESKEIETQNWSISQNQKNIMLFANRKGIISYDGKTWNLIKMPYIPFAIKRNPIDNKVYVGANNNYGYLEEDAKGFLKYISLSSDTSKLGVISKIIFKDSTIFFYGERTITRFSLNQANKFKRWHSKDYSPFTGMFTTNKNTFFNVFGKGLFRLEKDTLFPIVTGYYTENNEILFSLPYSTTRVLVGTDDSKLYTFDGIKYYNYNINDDGYLKESILADGQIISDSLYAFGTLYGGVEIVNKKTGKIVYTINYQNGLPDDEIYSLGLDNNNGLWVSHEFGISRVDFNMPIRNYSTYPGLKGNLISSVVHNDTLFVATNNGVYYLSEVKDYSEVKVWVKTRVKIKPRRTQSKTSSKTEEIEPEEKKSVKKLFSRLFSKEETPEPKQKKEVRTVVPKKQAPRTKIKYVKRKESKLKSINYIFKQVDNLNEKCTQLVSTEHGVLVASNTGLHHIYNLKSTKIVDNKYINQIGTKTFMNSYLIATNSGIFSLIFNDENKIWEPEYKYIDFVEPVYSANLNKKLELWLGSEDKIYLFLIDSASAPLEIKEYKIETDFPEQYKLDIVNDTLVVFLENGLYQYNIKLDTFQIYNPYNFKVQPNSRYILSQQGITWIRNNNKWSCINSNKTWSEQEEAYLKLFDDISSIIYDNKDNLWVINNSDQIYKINHFEFASLDPNFNIFFNRISNDEGLNFDISNLTFDPDNKAIYVKIIAPYYIKQNSTQYQYFVEGLMSDWSKWSADQDINLIVESGNYTLHVRAKDIWGNTSEIKSLKFHIKPPFTESVWFYALIGILIIVSFIFISSARERKLQRDKKLLEHKVYERTVEIEEKAEEIEAQRDEITDQRDKILQQKEEITDSINYASRIQNAILPIREHFYKAFNDHFILFKPRDIVSGDFYWIAEDDEKIYFTAADCTGHGVPGAFMSMLGVSSLNEIFGSDSNHLTASKILNLLREKIKYSLHQTGKDGENKDGMDMALCIYHKNENLIEYAGAYNPLYLIRDGKLIEHKADRMPIGIYHVEKESFTNHEIPVKKGDVIYIFSDGYADQFGGPGQTKFKTGNMKKLFVEISAEPMSKQQEILEERFYKWKGDLEQLDDIIIIGIRF